MTFQFPARADMPPVKLTWYEGTRPPRPAELEDGRKMPAEGRRALQGEQGHDHVRRLRRQPADHSRSEDEGSRSCRPRRIPRVHGSHEHGLGPRLQDGHAGRRRFLLLRPADGNLPVGQHRQAGGRPHRVGRREPQDDEPARAPTGTCGPSIARGGRCSATPPPVRPKVHRGRRPCSKHAAGRRPKIICLL